MPNIKQLHLKMKAEKGIYYYLYFLFFVFSLLYMLGANTRLGIYGVIASDLKYFILIISIVVFFLCIPKYSPRQLVLVTFLGLLVFIVGVKTENLEQLYLYLMMIIGAKDIPFRDVIKVHFFIVLGFCLFNMAASELGMMEKMVNTVPDERLGVFGQDVMRKDFGYGWSTDYAIHVFFILLDYWILKAGRFACVEYLFYAFAAVFVVVETDSRMATVNIILIIICELYIRHIKDCHKVSRFLVFFMVYSIPFFCVLSILATIAYDSSNLFWIGADLLLSNRLSLGHSAIEDVGVPLFGQVYKMYGAGNAGFGDAEYNFLDCAYVQSFVVCGFLFSLVLICLYVFICKNALTRRDYPLMMAILLSGIAGVIAPYTFNLKYCILLVAIVSKHNNKNHLLIKKHHVFRLRNYYNYDI